METAAECDHTWAVGVAPRDLDGVLDRFGTGGQEHRLVVLRAAHQVIQLGSQIGILVVSRNLEADMREGVQLLAYRFDHTRVIVPHVQHAYATHEIQVFLTLIIP
ncbi:hypothetical protein D3C79_879210 [compost metagenome]